MELHCGDTILDLPVTDESYRLRSLMSDHNITFKFSSAEYIDVPVGAWVEFQGLVYTLKKPSNFKRQGLRIFEYTLILDSPQGDLALYKCRNTVDKRLKFSYTGKPSEHLQMIVDNMNRNSSGWTVGACIDSVEVTISYNHNYCNEALKSLADKTKTEYEINNKEISLRKVEYNKDAPLALSYGKGGGFKPGVGRENYNDSNPIGILFVQGGERNINKSSYGSSELLLPKNQTIVYNNRTYVTDSEGYSVKNANATSASEGSLDLSSIYPSRIGAVSSVAVVNESKNFYDIIDASIPDTLNYNDYLIAGETMTIMFQSGMLAGDDKQFEISYNHTLRKFEITPQEIDGMTMPGGSYIPRAGDQYAVFGIQLPDAYICDNVNKTGASWDMLREAVKYLYENEDQKFSFTGELDEVWSKKDWDNIGSKIKIGGYVHFSDANFQKDGIDIRIVNIKDYLNNPHAPVIELSNSVSGTSFSTEIGKIDQNEVVTQDSYKASLSFTKRRFRDAQETLKMLNSALLNFSSSISPVTINTMQLLVGDESLQFKFVDRKGTDGFPAATISDGLVYDNVTKTMSFTSKWLQHMSLGIKTMSSSHKPSEYKYWLIDDFSRIMGTEEAAKSYYLYVVCSKSTGTGHFILSESAIKMENDSDPNNYYLLTGILNSEYEGERSFVTVYGFTEILPGRITTDRIMSPDGLQFWSFVESAFVLDNGKSGASRVRFSFNENGDGQLKLIGSITQVTPGGTAVDVNPSIRSFVYKKAASKPTTPTGGTYLSPIPDGWSDGIPDGTDQLWESSRIFTINELAPQQSAWTEPRALTDTIDLEYMYSSVVSNPSDPITTPANWSGTPGTDTMWKAERIKKNNVWGDWNIYKIKGETGVDAITIAIAGNNIFKFPKNSNVPINETVALTANVQGLETPDYEWGYVVNGNFTSWGIYAQTRTVNVSALGAANSLTVRCYTNSKKQYDDYTLYRLYDGSDSITVILSNEAHVVACDKDGVPKSGEIAKAFTQVNVFKGTDPLVFGTDWVIDEYVSDGAIFSQNQDNISLTSFNANVYSAYCDITVMVGELYVTKRFSVSKSTDGQTGQTGPAGSPGINGANGVNGADGTSIFWQGNMSSAPLNPQNGWAYYNTTAKKSYIYWGAWYQMTVDGVDGTNGTDGLSIVWKGESSTPPSSPVKNWAYRDTDNGLVYIYDGSAWVLMTRDGTDGVDGTDGTNGLSVYITYNDSATTPATPTGNGTINGWHTNVTASIIWMSQKIASSASDGAWSAPFRIKGDKGDTGEPGKAGNYTEYRYQINGSRTSAPPLINTDVAPANWNTSMPNATFLMYIWQIAATKTSTDELVGTWTSPAMISPVAGGPPVGGLDYDNTKQYIGSPIRCDVVKLNNTYYIARADKGTFSGHSPADADMSNYWNTFGASYESLATAFLWAEGAQIANFMFLNQQMASQAVSANKSYIGIAYGKTSDVKIDNAAQYKWGQISTLGLLEPNGSLYTWIKFSDNSNGASIYDIPTVNTKYVGIAINKAYQTKSTIATDYVWTACDNKLGIKVPSGAALYTWIKYSIDAYGSEMSNSPLSPNLLLDGAAGYIQMLKATIGRFRVADGDIIGTDIDRIERLRLTTTAIPPIAALSSAWEIIDLGDGVEDYVGYCYCTHARDEYDTDQLVDTITAEYSENFNLPSIGNIRVDGGMSRIGLNISLANGTTLTGDDTIEIWQGTTLIATGTPDESIYVNASGNLTCKIISTVTISGMGDGESYEVTISQGYQGIVQQKASEKTLIGSNGLYSMFGTSKYLYFSKDYGFEVVMGNSGIQVTTSGVKKWNGSSWVAVSW